MYVYMYIYMYTYIYIYIYIYIYTYILHRPAPDNAGRVVLASGVSTQSVILLIVRIHPYHTSTSAETIFTSFFMGLVLRSGPPLGECS